MLKREEKSSHNTGGGQDEPSVELDGDVGSIAVSGQLSADDLFEILRNQRRRDVLRFFFEGDHDVVELGTLAEHIAAAEFETTTERLTSSERKRMYVSLYQCHLPKMDDAGVITFDSNRKTLELGENAERLEPYLYLDSDADDELADETADARAARPFLAASAGGLLLAVASAAGAVPAALVVELLVPLLSVVVGAIGVARLVQDRR